MFMSSVFLFIQNIFLSFQPKDIFDILVVAFLIYAFLALLKQTHSYFILAGLLILLGLYFISKNYNLVLTRQLLQSLITFFIVILVVVFRTEIRYLLEWLATFGRNLFKRQKRFSETDIINIIVQTADYLVNKKIGGLIVFSGSQPIERLLSGGHNLNGQASVPLLTSIFDPTSPGHDGAVIIEGSKVKKFAVHLPLAKKFEKFGRFGTRHRAALGLTEQSDALCIVISEERGIVSVAYGGKLKAISEPAELKVILKGFLKEKFPTEEKPWHAFITNNFLQKLFSLFIALILWFIFIFQAGVINRDFQVPVEFRFLPKDYVIDQMVPKEISVTLTGNNQDFRSFDESGLKFLVNLETVEEGWNKMGISEKQISYPPYFLVINISPNTIRFHIKKISP